MLNRVQKTHFPALLFNNKMRQVGQKMTVKFYYIFLRAASFFLHSFSFFSFSFLYLAFLFGMRDDKFTNVLPFSRSHLIFILFSANISFYWLPFFFLPSAEVERGLGSGSGGSRWVSPAPCAVRCLVAVPLLWWVLARCLSTSLTFLWCALATALWSGQGNAATPPFTSPSPRSRSVGWTKEWRASRTRILKAACQMFCCIIPICCCHTQPWRCFYFFLAPTSRCCCCCCRSRYYKDFFI